MKKIYIFYILSILVCIISFGSIYFLGSKIMIIQYLLLSVLPIILNMLLNGIYVYSTQDNNIIRNSIIFSIIYTFFMVLSIIIFNSLGVFNIISNNSKGLYTDGFSIGSEIVFNVTDAVLPAVLCFLLAYISGTIMKRVRQAK